METRHRADHLIRSAASHHSARAAERKAREQAIANWEVEAKAYARALATEVNGAAAALGLAPDTISARVISPSPLGPYPNGATPRCLDVAGAGCQTYRFAVSPDRARCESRDELTYLEAVTEALSSAWQRVNGDRPIPHP